MKNLPATTLFLRHWLPLLILAAASFCIFWPARGHQFLINWDDLQYVTENPAVQGITFKNIQEAFSTLYVGNYAPLQIISYMFDFQLWGMNASGFIFTNILLHTANGILFYLLLKSLAKGDIWPLFAALLFLLHPVQVESVVWVSQRKNVLAMFFMLISLHAYLRYSNQLQEHRKILYLLSLVAFALSLLSKSVTVILPPLLLLHDHCFLQKQNLKQLLYDKIPYIIIAGIFAVAAVYSHSAQTLGGGTSYHGGSPYTTFLTMLPIVITYIRMIFYPSGLSAFYDPPIKTGIDLQVAGAAALIALLIAAGTVLYRQRKESFFWFALFFVALLPVLQIVPIVTLMNDRYLYFPMLGAAPLIGILALRDTTWPDLSANLRNQAVVSACLLALLAYAAVTVHRIPVWQDSYFLWKDTVTRAPNVHLVHEGLGESLLERSQLDDAIQQFMISLKLQQDASASNLSIGKRNALASTHNNLGTAYGMKGMTDAALHHFTTAVRLDPGFHKAHFNLGNALGQSGRLEQALSSFEQAIRLNPANNAYRANLEMTRQLISRGIPTQK